MTMYTTVLVLESQVLVLVLVLATQVLVLFLEVKSWSLSLWLKSLLTSLCTAGLHSAFDLSCSLFPRTWWLTTLYIICM